LRLYRLDPSFRGAEDETAANIIDFVQLSDPDKKFNTIKKEDTAERLLQFDLDVESL